MLSSDELNNIVRRYMLLKDDGIVKLLCAYIIAMRLKIPPPWLAILGSSSGGKSMLLNSLANVNGFLALDNITASSFISGAKSAEGNNSLLYDVDKGSFLVFKDFTTILSKQKEARGEIIGLLRKIYDGEMDRKTGNIAGVQKWEGKIGVLLGSTSTYYSKMGEFSDMGERLLAYQFEQPDDEELGERIFEDGLIDFEAKTNMRAAFKEYLDNSGIEVPQEVADLPKFAPQDKKDLIDLANLATTARSGLEREQWGRDKTITQKHFKEKIARFLKELIALSYGMMILNKHDTGQAVLLPLDRRILYNIALDSIPYNRRLVLVQMVKFGSSATISSLNKYIGLGDSAIKIALEDLHAHFIVDFHESQSGNLWELKQKWADIIKKFEYMDITPNVVNSNEIGIGF